MSKLDYPKRHAGLFRAAPKPASEPARKRKPAPPRKKKAKR